MNDGPNDKHLLLQSFINALQSIQAKGFVVQGAMYGPDGGNIFIDIDDDEDWYLHVTCYPSSVNSDWCWTAEFYITMTDSRQYIIRPIKKNQCPRQLRPEYISPVSHLNLPESVSHQVRNSPLVQLQQYFYKVHFINIIILPNSNDWAKCTRTMTKRTNSVFWRNRRCASSAKRAKRGAMTVSYTEFATRTLHMRLNFILHLSGQSSSVHELANKGGVEVEDILLLDSGGSGIVQQRRSPTWRIQPRKSLIWKVLPTSL